MGRRIARIERHRMVWECLKNRCLETSAARHACAAVSPKRPDSWPIVSVLDRALRHAGAFRVPLNVRGGCDWHPKSSTDDGAFHSQQLTKLAQLPGDMADADRAMMRRTLGVPGIHEFSRSHRETIAAVGVANFKNRPRLGCSLSDQQFELSVSRLNNRKQSYWTMPNRHLDGEPAANLAMVHTQRTDLGLALGDGDVAGPVMSHQDHIVVKIAGVILRERTPYSEATLYLHGLSVLDLVFAGHGYASRREQAGAKDDGADGVFVLGVPCTFIVVGKGPQPVNLDQMIQRNRSTCSAFQFYRRTV